MLKVEIHTSTSRASVGYLEVERRLTCESTVHREGFSSKKRVVLVVVMVVYERRLPTRTS
jgi:hypothetical protein